MNVNEKIAHLVRELGWTQEYFARRAGLNRHTARHILLRPQQQLRNRTVQSCANALGLTVAELTDKAIPELLERVQSPKSALTLEEIRSSLPGLATWMEHHPDQAIGLTADDLRDLAMSHCSEKGQAPAQWDPVVDRIRRKRDLLHKVEILSGTEHLPFLEWLTNLLYEKVNVRREH